MVQREDMACSCTKRADAIDIRLSLLSSPSSSRDEPGVPLRHSTNARTQETLAGHNLAETKQGLAALASILVGRGRVVMWGSVTLLLPARLG